METTHKKSRIYIYTMMALLYVLPGMISGLSQIAIINKIVVLRIMGHRIPLNTPKELTENLKETIMGPGFFVIAVLVCMNVASWLYISIINTIPVQKKIIWVCSDSLRLRHTDVISKIFEDPWDKLYLHHLGENVSFDPKDKRISEAVFTQLGEFKFTEFMLPLTLCLGVWVFFFNFIFSAKVCANRFKKISIRITSDLYFDLTDLRLPLVKYEHELLLKQLDGIPINKNNKNIHKNNDKNNDKKNVG
eukprot:GHVR01101963.1.p1 GENE.GHVR01101963.1~~GHVR01101963.1.p1  ORF type:complete len:248 (+),score=37.58 GHVR01101963.1:1-744(+)